MAMLTASFNQDHTHLAVGTRRGWRIWACEPFDSRHLSTEATGVSVVQMLWSSSLVALVGTGEHAGDSPRRVRLWNTSTNEPAGVELSFPTPVLAVRMNLTRLIVVLQTEVHIFELMSMAHLHVLATAPNPLGLVALSPDADASHLATLAADATLRSGRVVMFAASALHVVNVVQAHRSALSCMCLSTHGDLLATASEKGTVVRVHSFPQVRRAG